jgi:FolB domain-containing protein
MTKISDTNFLCKLVIKELNLSVRLGCRPHEKEKDQIVSVNIEIYLQDMPLGGYTDDIENVICYSELSKYIQNFVKGKSFNLVEKFSNDIHACICKFLTDSGFRAGLVKVITSKTMSKKSPIKGGVSFVYIKDIS